MDKEALTYDQAVLARQRILGPQADDDPLELIRGCWNIYVDDDGRLFPHCPMCTEDVELDWQVCPDCGYPEDDDEDDDSPDIEHATPVLFADVCDVNWLREGF